MRLHTLISILGIAGILTTGCSTSPTAPPEGASPRQLITQILHTSAFDPSFFTQGLELDPEGNLLVGTGGYGTSGLYRVDPTGQVIQSVSLPRTDFGEGITRAGEDLWQLTWREHRAYQRDARSFAVKKTFPLREEGWGICFDGTHLWTSDGSSQLKQRNSSTFEVERTVTVSVGEKPLEYLNELECADGAILANVFLTTQIAKISPEDGSVTALIDASALPNNAQEDENNVLNGIAHIPGTDTFYLTGKRWPDLYTVRLVSHG